VVELANPGCAALTLWLKRITLNAVVFTTSDRDRIRSTILEMARADPRVLAGAELGSRAIGDGDQWSDLDLSFGVVGEGAIAEVLADWTSRLGALGAVHLFDVANLGFEYRVLLFPGNLQVDISLAPADQFGALGPKFNLLFGEAVARTRPEPATAPDAFGMAVHHAVRAGICIRRGRLWQAEYWLHELRDLALELACQRQGLPAREGRGYDQLPSETLALAAGTLATGLDEEELLRSLDRSIDLLLSQAGDTVDPAIGWSERLRELTRVQR